MLDQTQENAARLLAQGRLTQEAIAAECGIGRATLNRWREQPEFRSRIETYKADFAEAMRAAAVADVTERIAFSNQLLASLKELVRQIGPEELAYLKEFPGQAINLYLRVQKAADSCQDRLLNATADLEEETDKGQTDPAQAISLR